MRSISADDLDECAARVASWHRAGCATPLLLTRDEFAGSLDAFPIEYGEILDTHRVLFGADPFAGLTIRDEDLRRECEMQVKSHLVHLRENYIECRGRPVGRRGAGRRLGAARSRCSCAASRGSTACRPTPTRTSARMPRSRPGSMRASSAIVLALAGNRGASGVDAMRLYPAYLAAVEQLWRFIDRWRATAGQ